jgi:hypothetical protein
MKDVIQLSLMRHLLGVTLTETEVAQVQKKVKKLMVYFGCIVMWMEK